MRRLSISSITRRNKIPLKGSWATDLFSSSLFHHLYRPSSRGHLAIAPSRYFSGAKNDISTDLDKKLQSSNDTTVDNENPIKRESYAVKLDPRAIFPWRHSPHPLPRLIPDHEEFITQGGYLGPHMPPMNQFFRVFGWINSAGFLGAKILNYGEWKSDLEFAFMHAFSTGVQGVLDDVYHFPKQEEGCKDEDGDDDDDDDDDDGVQKDKAVEADKNSANDEDGKTKEEDSNESNNGNAHEHDIDRTDPQELYPIEFQHTFTPDDEYQLKKHSSEEYASHGMLEPALINLYRSAHTSCNHKLQIKLRSRPKSAEIQSLFLIPFLTRTEVEDNVALKHSFRNIVKAMHQKSNELGRELSYYELGNLAAEKLDDMSLEQIKRRRRKGLAGDDDYTVQMTVVAQVAIQCDEVFVVRDTDTGDVVQGDVEENVNDVTHLVRFETVIDLDLDDRQAVIGGWQITDWDDMLDGNIWVS